MLILAAMPAWLIGILVALFLLVCVMLILTVLIQRPAGGGLSGAFGSGAGSGQTAFGAKTGDALTIATIAIFVVYLLFAIGLNFGARPPKATIVPVAGGTQGTGATNGATGSTGATAATGSTGATAPTGTTGSIAPTTTPAPTGTTGTTTPPSGPTATPAATGATTPPPAPTGSTGATPASTGPTG